MEFDWTILEKVGIGGVALALVFFGYKIIMFFLDRWKDSTEALDRNSEAYSKLSEVFEKSLQREIEFQEKIMDITEDTNKKVNEIHKKIV